MPKLSLYTNHYIVEYFISIVNGYGQLEINEIFQYSYSVIDLDEPFICC
jgi:hypothetical protein